MAVTTIRGNTQILAGSIVDAQISASAAIATTKLADAANFILRGGSVAFTADESMGSHKLTNLATPTAGTDAANKAYVDGVAQGLQVKRPVEGSTTAGLNTYTQSGAGVGATLTKSSNGSINSEAVDGVTFTVGNRILVKNETSGNAPYNGIYVVTTVGSGGAPWVLTRATDADEPADITEGAFVFVVNGSTLGGSGWVQIQAITTVDTDNVSWFQFTAAGGSSFTAGDGIDITTGVISVKLDGASLTKSGSGLKITDMATTTILIGDGSSHPVAHALSGDATMTNTGVVTVANQVKLSKYIVREVPSGSINGSNTSYTLANTPVSGSESVYQNGLLQAPGGSADYTISGATITYNTAPPTGDLLVVSYISS